MKKLISSITLLLCCSNAIAGMLIYDGPEFKKWEGGHIDYFISPEITGSKRINIDQAVANWHNNTILTFNKLTTEPSVGSPPVLVFTEYTPISYLIRTEDNTTSPPTWETIRNDKDPSEEGGPTLTTWCRALWGAPTTQYQGVFTRDDFGEGRDGGRRFVELGAHCNQVDTITHEIGHAIGFLHEHQREDRDVYFDYYRLNVDDPENQTQFWTVWEPATSDTSPAAPTMGDWGLHRISGRDAKMIGPMDFESIMTYSTTAFNGHSSGGPVTLEPNASYASSNYGGATLSPGDIDAVKILYGDTFSIRSGNISNACLSVHSSHYVENAHAEFAWAREANGYDFAEITMEVRVEPCESGAPRQQWLFSGYGHKRLISSNGMCLGVDPSTSKARLEHCVHWDDDYSSQAWAKLGNPNNPQTLASLSSMAYPSWFDMCLNASSVVSATGPAYISSCSSLGSNSSTFTKKWTFHDNNP